MPLNDAGGPVGQGNLKGNPVRPTGPSGVEVPTLAPPEVSAPTPGTLPPRGSDVSGLVASMEDEYLNKSWEWENWLAANPGAILGKDGSVYRKGVDEYGDEVEELDSEGTTLYRTMESISNRAATLNKFIKSGYYEAASAYLSSGAGSGGGARVQSAFETMLNQASAAAKFESADLNMTLDRRADARATLGAQQEREVAVNKGVLNRFSPMPVQDTSMPNHSSVYGLSDLFMSGALPQYANGTGQAPVNGPRKGGSVPMAYMDPSKFPPDERGGMR